MLRIAVMRGEANEVRLAKYFDVKGNLFCENRQTQLKSQRK